MASFTEHYGLQELDSGDSFSLNGQKYTTADRVTIDRLLYLGAQAHQHNGASAASVRPTAAGTATSTAGAGQYQSGVTVYYEYTWVDGTGAESVPGPATSITLPGAVTTPAPPAAVADTIAGTLPLGSYYYAITAYTTSVTAETAASSPVYVYVPGTGEVTLTFPSAPTGASGFNVYRLSPNAIDYTLLASVPVTDATYVDNGSATPGCPQGLPTGNATGQSYGITFTIPAEPPPGYTWNLYATTQAGNWTDSLLATITGTNSTGGTLTTYADTGAGAGVGTPPTQSEFIGSPSQINLATETQGVLPPAVMGSVAPSQVGAFPVVVTFSFPGALTPTDGQSVWVNEFPFAQIVSVRAAMPPDATPAATPVIVDVLQGTDAATPVVTSLFRADPYPEVSVGGHIGVPVAPSQTSPYYPVVLTQGEFLMCNLTQSGGGTTPTDHDLTVNVYMLVSVGPSPVAEGGSPTLPISYRADSFSSAGAETPGSIVLSSNFVAGDIAVLGVFAGAACDTPSGWTPVGPSFNTAVPWTGADGVAYTELSAHLFWKVVQSTDPGSSLPITFTGTAWTGAFQATAASFAGAVGVDGQNYTETEATADTISSLGYVTGAGTPGYGVTLVSSGSSRVGPVTGSAGQAGLGTISSGIGSSALVGGWMPIDPNYSTSYVEASTTDESIAPFALLECTLIPALVAPGIPVELLAAAGTTAGTVNVSVSFPDYDGGARISSFTVVASPGGTSINIPMPAPGTYVASGELTGLTSGTAYIISAFATNAVGNSPAITTTVTAP